eukprot:CAMPEP_0185762414 /NCGR_PEP_ID=MMETSP1174-20130828/21380_1 /TAXON_ID=35687 /ORGANISM="Dictyocha speculum, Strain CCMP1381" /LENGTH=111 /DNA_ID=CAMNT_0028444081 /DNA_START=904 /DNA_END=1239 /DNA_ORIENTATION=+
MAAGLTKNAMVLGSIPDGDIGVHAGIVRGFLRGADLDEGLILTKPQGVAESSPMKPYDDPRTAHERILDLERRIRPKHLHCDWNTGKCLDQFEPQILQVHDTSLSLPPTSV